ESAVRDDIQMITVETNNDGVRVHMSSRQPMIYLDQWAIYRLANNEVWKARLTSILSTRGTVYLSWMNIAEIATTSPDTSNRIRALLYDVCENWLLIDSNFNEVVEKESAGAQTSSPCLDENFLKQYYPYIHGGPLTLGTVVDLL